MSREVYDYKRKAITAATDLFYGEKVIKAITQADTVGEIARIMKSAREAE